ncbi:MAG TPA: preprotein translocase subunit SecG [Gammaproteobacteria bacterium]|nr:preprotein translocase subunit SecG [Gammaproteobacteria bacterium]
MLQTIVLVAHVGIALLIIGLVLLQRGKGADAGTGFGAGASGTVFGARGSATFFSRVTGVLAALFFVTSLTLAWLATQRTAPTSLLELAPAVETTTTPPASETPPAAVEPPSDAPAQQPNE